MSAVEHDHRPCRGCGVRQVREREQRLRAEVAEREVEALRARLHGGQEARPGVETGNRAPDDPQPRRTAQRVETLDITKEDDDA